MKLGYLGPEGTYSHQAALNFAYEEVELVQFKTISDVIYAVCKNEVDKCIVPVENSIEGTVNQTVDTILKNPSIKIEEELILPIRHCLVSKLRQDLKEIKTIISHSQALAQSRDYLNANFKNAEIRETTSTAEAAREVSNTNDEQLAAISSEISANIYNLTILDENIQDKEYNETKFLVLSLGNTNISEGFSLENSKTSIVLSLQNKPGSLYHILSIFNALSINLTKIESRPAKTRIGEYVFWIDFDGYIENEDIKIMINVLKKLTTSLRILGSYQIKK